VPHLIHEPYLIPFKNGATVEEYIGRDRDGSERVSVAVLWAPPGWIEPVQTPEFDEITVVLTGALQVEHAGEMIEVTEGQAIVTTAGETIQYSSPKGSRYVAVCMPAFDAGMAHREPLSTIEQLVQ
jgi:mannose-6-phosphate isomerase-like protein (cupin superfamily)